MSIYLDNHATTRVDPAVVEAMLPYLTETYGNPSSRHASGNEARKAVDEARARVAALLGAAPAEIVFTSGATESNNLALFGVMARAKKLGRDHLVVTAYEHHAVLAPARELESRGYRVTTVGVGPSGVIDPDDIARAIEPRTALVSVMAANNEIGTINPLKDIAERCAAKGAALHSDAAQMVGHTPIDVRDVGVDFLSLSAHKHHGPKGVGALYVRGGARRSSVAPIIFGGGQERGVRSGTIPVHQVVGLGAAAELASAALKNGAASRVGDLRDRLWARLRDQLPDSEMNGASEPRLPHNLNIAIPGVASEALLVAARELVLSTGDPALHSAWSQATSFRAIGVPEDRIARSIRIGLSRFTTVEEVDEAAAVLAAAAVTLRAMAV